MNQQETHVLRLIGENTSSPDVFVDTAAGLAQIRGSLNDAIEELTAITGAYTQTYLLPLQAERMFYRLETARDYLAYPLIVWDRLAKRKLTQTDLVKLSQEDSMWMQRRGYPKEYMILGINNLGIYPAQDAKGRILEIKYACVPTAYAADGDPIKLRTSWQRATVYYAVGEFYASRGDAARATEYHQRYLDTAGIAALHPSYFQEFNRLTWQPSAKD